MVHFEDITPIIHPQISTPTTLQEIFNSWSEVWILKYFMISDNGLWLAIILLNGIAILVYYGSFQPYMSTT